MSDGPGRAIQVLSVDIVPLTRDEFKAATVQALKGETPALVAKVNAEFLLRATRDQAFQAYLASTHINIADGIGVLWAARFLTLNAGKSPLLYQLRTLWQAAYTLVSLVVCPRFCRTPLPARIPGVDALHAMLEAAEQAKAPVYFLGAQEAINEGARQEIHARLPRLSIAGGRGGYFEDVDDVVSEINASGAGLLVVALGSPKQEYWIRDHMDLLTNVRVAVGEGGSLDFIAGDFRRAPGWLQRVGLEWLWRMFMNPNKTGNVSRGHRIWDAVPVFVCQVVRWKLKHRPTPPRVVGA